MRKALAKAGSRDLLCDVLRRVGPERIGAYLTDGPGFRVRFVGQEDQRVQRDGTRYWFEGTSLAADLAIEYDDELGLAVQQIGATMYQQQGAEGQAGPAGDGNGYGEPSGQEDVIEGDFTES